MKIKCKIKVTEGVIYAGIKEGVKAYLETIRKALEQDGDTYKDNTGSLRHSRLIRAGYKVKRLGRNIEATNKKGSFRGSVHSVHLQIFGY